MGLPGKKEGLQAGAWSPRPELRKALEPWPLASPGDGLPGVGAEPRGNAG